MSAGTFRKRVLGKIIVSDNATRQARTRLPLPYLASMGTGLAKVAGWFGVMNHIGIMVNGGKTIKENQRIDIDIDI